MADKNNSQKNKDDKPLLGGILSDCYEHILVPKSKQILTSMLVDGVYAVAEFVSNVVQKRVMNDTTPIVYTKPNQQSNYHNRYSQVNGTNKQSYNPNNPPKQDIGMRSATKLQYIVLHDPMSAKQFENTLKEYIRQFGVLRVSDFYDKYNQIKGDEEKTIKPIHVDFDFGWTREEDIHYVTNRDGYWFNLPVPQEIKG